MQKVFYCTCALEHKYRFHLFALLGVVLCVAGGFGGLGVCHSSKFKPHPTKPPNTGIIAKATKLPGAESKARSRHIRQEKSQMIIKLFCGCIVFRSWS
jgi:hypothetical protein